MRPIRRRGGEESADDCKTVLEQYKLYVEMADRTSGRRMIANSFFLAIQTAIIAAVFTSSKIIPGTDAHSRIGLAVCGILISILWLLILNSYRQLNSAKFRVIHEIEKWLPVAPFDKEWKLLTAQAKAPHYLSLSVIEQFVPLCIGGLYSFYCLSIILGSNELSVWLRSILH